MDSSKQIRKLNTLRGIAALIVFVTHFSDKTNWLNGVLGGPAGQYGVMLFFILSGFLMAHLYLDKAFNKQNVKSYAIARIGRVLPLYLLVVFASYTLSANEMIGLYYIPDGNALLSHLFFLKGESVLWTIPPELHFYLIFILCWYLAVNRVGYLYLLIAAVLIVLFFTNFKGVVGDVAGVEYNLFRTVRSLPYFFVGTVFGIMYNRIEIPNYMKKHWFVLALLLIPLMFPEFSPVVGDAKFRMWKSYEVLFVMSAVFFAIVFLVPNNNLLLANPIGDFIGKISYSLYLLHMPVIMQVKQWQVSIEMQLFYSLFLSILLAYLSFHLFERPVARMIRKRANNKVSAVVQAS